MHTFKDEQPKVIHYNDANNKRKLQKRRRKNIHIQRIVSSIALLICFIFAISAGFMLYSDNNDAYAINVDGKTVAVLTSEVEAEEAIENYLAEKCEAMGCNVYYEETVSIETVPAPKAEFTTPVKATEILDSCLTQVIDAVVVAVDGQEIFAVKDEDAAQNAIEKAKKYYITDNDMIIDAKIREEITMDTDVKEPSEILSEDEAVNYLLFGKPYLEEHTVITSDETLWTISDACNMSIEDLQAANPGLTSEDLTVGMSVKLESSNPAIKVVLLKEVVETAAVDYDVQKKDNSTMLRGQEKVVTEGQKGEAEVTLHVVEENGQEVSSEQVDYEVTKEPVTKVIERGTKMVVASRGDGGYGVVGWPIVGRITSRFGPRWGGFHTGLDIDGYTGQPVAAAESGKVIFTGWSGGYGYLVKIDHGSGLQTWYAHLSKIYVSVGEKVEKGDTIAAVGSTGNSTGSHLHFEVRLNGTAYDPLKYLP